jgi:hypothetical protein
MIGRPFVGLLGIEGVPTGDGRLLAFGSVDWGLPPLPLMTSVGTERAVAGRIDHVWRQNSLILGSGVVYIPVSEDHHLQMEVTTPFGADGPSEVDGVLTFDSCRVVAAVLGTTPSWPNLWLHVMEGAAA